MSNSLFNVYTVDAYANFVWGGEPYPDIAITSWAVSYPLNNIPTAQIRPAMGQPLINNAMAQAKGRHSFTQPSTSIDSSPIEIYLIIRSGNNTVKYRAFNGFISAISFTQALTGASASAGMVMNCVHKSALLSSFPPSSRLFMNPTTAVNNPMAVNQLTYQDKTGFVPATDTLETSLGISVGGNPMKGIIDLLTYMYNVEANQIRTGQGAVSVGVGTNVTTIQKDAVDLLKTVDTMNMEFAPEQMTTDYILTQMNILNEMAGRWSGTSGWQLLLNYVDKLWGNILITDSTIKIIPNVSCLTGNFEGANTAIAVINQVDIFGMTRNRAVDPVPVKGINLLSNKANQDKIMDNGDWMTSVSYSYPFPVKEQGMYLYVKPPEWLQFYRGLRMYAPTDGATPSTTVNSNEDPTNKVNLGQKETVAGAEASEDTWMTNIAKTEFGAYRWGRDSISLDLNWDKFYLLVPGQLVKVVHGETTASAGQQMFTEDFIGQVRSLNLSCTPGNMRLEVVLGSVRTATENAAYTEEKHPLYTNFDPSSINSVSLFTIQ